MYPVTEEAPAGAQQPPTVTIVAAVVSSATYELAADLRRDSLRVEVASADVLRQLALPSV